MDLTGNIIINTYSILLLTIIFIHSSKNIERNSLQHMLYMTMLEVIILMLVVDILSRFDGKPDTVYQGINHFGNFLMFLISPLLPSLWLLYAHFQVFQEEWKTKRLIYPLIAINAVHAVMVILTQFNGWFYYIDSDNIYHRGPLYLLSASITIVLIFIAFLLVIVNRGKVEKKYYFSLAFFTIPPFICIILQIAFYGMSLILNGVVLSLLIVFLNIQNSSIYTDYMTGVYNRKKLDIYLREKINTSTEDQTFSAILLDVNDFKSINDTFGHDMGDKALKTSVRFLKSCLRSNDLIARFGGDEFCIVLDISNRDDLDEVVGRINCCLDKYNESCAQPYKISYSMGYAVYDYNSHMKVEEFQKLVDKLMYENKKANLK